MVEFKDRLVLALGERDGVPAPALSMHFASAGAGTPSRSPSASTSLSLNSTMNPSSLDLKPQGAARGGQRRHPPSTSSVPERDSP